MPRAIVVAAHVAGVAIVDLKVIVITSVNREEKNHMRKIRKKVIRLT